MVGDRWRAPTSATWRRAKAAREKEKADRAPRHKPPRRKPRREEEVRRDASAESLRRPRLSSRRSRILTRVLSGARAHGRRCRQTGALKRASAVGARLVALHPIARVLRALFSAFLWHSASARLKLNQKLKKLVLKIKSIRSSKSKI